MLVDLKYDPEALVYPREKFNDKDYWDNEMPEEFKTLKWKDIFARYTEGIYQYYDVNIPYIDGYEFEDYYEGPSPLMPDIPCTMPYGYGLCDNYRQILERDEDVKRWIDNPDRKFFLFLCCMWRENQPEHGGFRYHKWGGYIGDQELCSEYLYDDKDVDRVFTYRLVEIIKEPEDVKE